MPTMKTSSNGYNLIKQEEGYRQYSYRDTAGFLTIGYGHKILPTEKLVSVTIEQAQVLLESDTKHVEFVLNLYLDHHNIIINQNQFDALIDFGFNLGTGSLLKMLSHGIDKVPSQIVLWTHSEGQVLHGLQLRRQRELALWQSPIVNGATDQA